MTQTLRHPITFFDPWRANPAEVDATEHRAYCYGGYVDVTQDGYDQILRCPVCEYERELQACERCIEVSGIGSRYFGLEWSDLDMVDPMPRIKAACERIGSVLDAGHNMLLTGEPGSGKTQAAVLCMKAAIRKGYSARLGNLGRLALDIRASYGREAGSSTEAQVVRELSAVDLLVLDDMGAGETVSAEVERRVLYLVLEARQNAAKSSVLTTNLSPQKLQNTIGARIMNRLNPLAIVPFTHGKNYRLKTREVLW